MKESGSEGGRIPGASLRSANVIDYIAIFVFKILASKDKNWKSASYNRNRMIYPPKIKKIIMY